MTLKYIKGFNHYIFFLLLGVSLLSGCKNNKGQLERVEMPFEKYNFVREQFTTDHIGLLMGNAEMGGLAANDGLGFEQLWFTDVWADRTKRIALQGPRLVLMANESAVADYKTELSIKDGVLSTQMVYENGMAYSAESFFSKTNKHRWFIQVKNQSASKLCFNLKLPEKDCAVETLSPKQILGNTIGKNKYTEYAWSFSSSTEINLNDGTKELILEGHDSVMFCYSLVTNFDSDNYLKTAKENTYLDEDFSKLLKKHKTSWELHWKRLASVILPESDNAKWFYRSLYTLYATSGAQNFLPGELQFSTPDPDWQMCPFTYGHAGWSVWALASIGDEETAKLMARNHYNPAALKENLKRIFPKTGSVEMSYKGVDKGIHTYFDEYNEDAIAFGHNIYADNIGKIPQKDFHWDMQRQLDAFAASFFHVLSDYYPDETFTKETTYPVLKGTAELWSSLVKWDSVKNHYFLPPLLSVSEDIMETSILDAVLAARWNLKIATAYAEKLGKDEFLAKKWKEIHDKLYVPQNEDIYLEFLDDQQTRKGGGYFGIRAFMYLGFPTMECINEVDQQKARRSLDLAWMRNNEGEGMITFIMNWFAITEAMLGYGDKALALSQLSTTIKDSTDCALYEVFAKNSDDEHQGINIYFLTGYSSFIVSQMVMLCQSYSGQIKPFPAVPSAWENVAFYDVPVSNGFSVSGEMEGGRVKGIAISKNDMIVHTSEESVIIDIKKL